VLSKYGRPQSAYSSSLIKSVGVKSIVAVSTAPSMNGSGGPKGGRSEFICCGVIQIFWFRGLGNTIPGPDVVQEKVTIRVDATIEGFPEFALGNLSSQTVQTGESPCPILIQAPALIRQRRGSQNLPDAVSLRFGKRLLD
jgi:hypothetical protein